MNKNKASFKVVVFCLVLLSSINLLAATTPTIQQSNIYYISTGNLDCILISDNRHCAMIDGADNDDDQLLVDYLNNLKIK